MVRVIRAVNPKVFLFENVRGLLSAKWDKNGSNGEIFRDVLKAFCEEVDDSCPRHLWLDYDFFHKWQRYAIYVDNVSLVTCSPLFDDLGWLSS